MRRHPLLLTAALIAGVCVVIALVLWIIDAIVTTPLYERAEAEAVRHYRGTSATCAPRVEEAPARSRTVFRCTVTLSGGAHVPHVVTVTTTAREEACGNDPNTRCISTLHAFEFD